jgi:hypothetical protein
LIAHVQPGLKPKYSVRLSDPAEDREGLGITIAPSLLAIADEVIE